MGKAGEDGLSLAGPLFSKVSLYLTSNQTVAFMKGYFLPLCLAFVFSAGQVSAQLSKEESKEWKRKAKELSKSPEELKKLSEGKASAEAEVSRLKKIGRAHV